jgi:hypothetical protein
MAIQESERPPLGMVARQIQTNRLKGDRRSFWGVTMWGAYRSNIAEYEKTFGGVLNGQRMGDLLKGKKNPVLIDIMSLSEALATLLRQFDGKEKFGLAISLEDLRTDEEKWRDAKRNIVQISGDILETSTWKRIEEQLQGRKADLIMERGHDGFSCMPRDSRLYASFLNKAWGLLKKEGGIFIAEVPYGFKDQAKKMVDGFRVNGIETSEGEAMDLFPSIKIVRAPNSPEKLPFPKR